MSRRDPEHLREMLVLPPLCGLQILMLIETKCGRVGHAGVQPQREEFVTEVIVLRDIFYSVGASWPGAYDRADYRSAPSSNHPWSLRYAARHVRQVRAANAARGYPNRHRDRNRQNRRHPGSPSATTGGNYAAARDDADQIPLRAPLELHRRAIGQHDHERAEPQPGTQATQRIVHGAIGQTAGLHEGSAARGS